MRQEGPDKLTELGDLKRPTSESSRNSATCKNPRLRFHRTLSFLDSNLLSEPRRMGFDANFFAAHNDIHL
jgi:hypothetical protein